jgi:lipopolysaccharide transport system ATP-binding protein
LGKIGDVAKEGRTVLFVSHNMPAVTRLCETGVLLEDGKIKEMGEITEIIARYLISADGNMAEHNWSDPTKAPGDQVARLKSVRVISQGKVTDTVDIRYPVMIEMEYWNMKPGANLMVAINFYDSQGVILFATADIQERQWQGSRPAGLYKSWCEIPGNLFAEGVVKVLVEVCTREPLSQSHVREVDAVAFNVIDTGAPGSVRGGWGRPLAGVVRPMVPWKTEKIDREN